MLLTKIVLHNFAAFEGTQEFNLTPSDSPEQNIILIGAMNGSGKTSLLEAVKLCLYGERNSGLLGAREVPDKFIRERFNYKALNRHETEMWVELTLDEVELPGARHLVQVRRTWHFHPVHSSYERDDFTIIKDGKLLQIIDPEHWQDFINDNIPPGIAGFFFFDGEKIQELANDTNDRVVLRNSIRNLLGLSIYSRLTEDLINHTDNIRRDADKVTDDELKQLEDAEAKLQQLISDNLEKHLEAQSTLQGLLQQDEKLEREARRMVGAGANVRDNLQKEIVESDAQKRAVNEEILRIAGEFLPFAIAGKICDDLRTQIESEEKLRQWEASKVQIYPQLERVVERVFYNHNAPESNLDISPSQRDFYASRLTDEWESIFISRPQDAANVVLHELSPKDERSILSTLDQVAAQSLGMLKDLLTRRERASRRFQDASRELRNLPEENAQLSDLFDTHRANDAEKQAINRQIGKLQDEHSKYERELKSIQNRIINIKNKLIAAKADRQRIELARKVQETLIRYEQELQKRKLTELELSTTEMYSRLARKNDFVGKVTINPTTFDVTLHDTSGHVREKRSLSAGEKQIYAISLLWGLARTSNIELPIIIDTPFARLDSEHRTRIAEHYFPRASKQVVVLSTDEEIDQHYTSLLKPYIGRTLIVEYIDAEQRASVREGYF